jgi:hypothetical protein
VGVAALRRFDYHCFENDSIPHSKLVILLKPHPATRYPILTTIAAAVSPAAQPPKSM